MWHNHWTNQVILWGYTCVLHENYIRSSKVTCTDRCATECGLCEFQEFDTSKFSQVEFIVDRYKFYTWINTLIIIGISMLISLMYSKHISYPLLIPYLLDADLCDLGVPHLKPTKLERIFVAVITFFPFLLCQ